jgi:ABC-type amino acid transport substrate-binding protein
MSYSTELSTTSETKRPVLVIAFSEIDNFPFEYEENGEFKGMHIEIIQEVAGELGFDIQAIRMPWRRIIASLKVGGIDALSYASGYKHFSHRAWIHTNNALSVNAFYLLKKDSRKDIKYKGDLSSLKGLTIATLSGYQFTLTPDEEIPFTIMKVETEQQLFDLVELGRVDASIAPRGSFSRLTLEQQHLKKIPKPLSLVYSHIGFSKSNFEEEFSLTFAEKMVEFRNSSEWMKIQKKYAKLQY